MRHGLHFWAAVFVGVGAFSAFTGRNPALVTVFLIIGLLLALTSLLLDGHERRPRRGRHPR